MTRRLRACAVLALLVCAGASPSVFEATSEFQEIQEGQQVPAGLHYRINLETGKKEAKLIDPNQVRRRDARLLGVGPGLCVLSCHWCVRPTNTRRSFYLLLPHFPLIFSLCASLPPPRATGAHARTMPTISSTPQPIHTEGRGRYESNSLRQHGCRAGLHCRRSHTSS